MIRIAPSLLACDFARIAEEVGRVEQAGADWLHLDVMDGHFVPNLTIGPPVVEKIAAVARVPLDVHVMITDPLAFAPRFLDAGAGVYTFHVEAPGDARAVIELVKRRGRQAGMALNPETPAATLKPFAADLDLILVMSVHPGFGGQRFIAGVLAKVREIRYDWGFAGDVQVDGGIGLDTIGACAAAGANVFVAGSAVFGAPDIKARIAELRRRARAAASPSD